MFYYKLTFPQQSLYVKAQEIAQEYTDPEVRAVYERAAKTFRLPFLDYFRPRGGEVTFPGIIETGGKETHYPYDFSMPRVMTDEKVMIRTPPNNILEEKPNPLSTYQFSKEPGKNIPKDDWDALFGNVRDPRCFLPSPQSIAIFPTLLI